MINALGEGGPGSATPAIRRASPTIAAALGWLVGCDTPPAVAPQPLANAGAEYVGAAACGACHTAAHAVWATSHHALAMQEATDATVLGDFGGTTFEAGGVITHFMRDGTQFVVETDAAAARRTYPVAFTFGVAPLQQYLLETAPGRLQALGIAWDARPDGQRWFHLYPDAAGHHADVLHWTQASQNWNSNCADCHSTGVRKGYDATKGTFTTTYVELNVGCEACHGPGSRHVAAPAAPYGAAAANIDTCAPCHSRRAQIGAGFQPGRPWLDYYLPAAVAPPLYHVDGQILEEVYVHGSFLQSRMHQAGVTCMDCHDAHSARLVQEGNALCAQCHSPAPPPRFPTLAARAKPYDHPDHHFHAAIDCVDCHMPSRIYMEVDERRDHSFRVPRPDLSVAYGTPNACNGCHQDQDAAWADATIRGHAPSHPARSGADVLALAASGHFDAETRLSAAAQDETLPAIVRRSALLALGRYEFTRSQDAIAAGLGDAAPLVRLGAIEGLARLPEAPRFGAVKRLLQDPLKALRIAAAPEAAAYLAQAITPDERALIDAALTEYRQTLAFNAERPAAHTNRANLLTALNDPAGARAAFDQALALEPNWIPALVNLADLHRAAGRDVEGGALLARAAALRPANADAAYARGLWFIRQGQPARGLEQLKRAHELAPQHLRNAYVLALALNAAGESDHAIAVLETAVSRFGGHRAPLVALATFHRERGEVATALAYAQRLRDTFGTAYAGLVAELAATTPSSE